MTDVLTANGLQIPTIGDAGTPGTILGDLAGSQRALIDANLDTDADSPLGQLNGIWAERERLIWEALAVAYNGFNPDAAEDFLLDAVSAITGTKRAAATKGTVKVNLNIDA